MAFEQTWRWFGPGDPITLKEIKQTGASGVVTALHQVPIGEVWAREDILRRKHLVEAEGLTWSVAESVPVHDDIKKRTGAHQQFIKNYQQSIQNLGQCGIDTICYNFMPVLDWSRTDLAVRCGDGSITTQFEAKVFAAFDLFILRRPEAERSYSGEMIQEARTHFDGLTTSQKDTLLATILQGFPGSEEAYTLEQFRSAILQYRDLGDKELREHLHLFIRDIIPVAEDSGVLMGLHPDDPPWSLLGLPRVVSTTADLEGILNVIDSPSNGITLCTGSLGASPRNDVVDMAQRFAHRVNFLHLRNVSRGRDGDFIEVNHLEGDVDMFSVLEVMIIEQERRRQVRARNCRLPFRPDHGRLMQADGLKPRVYPGYSLFGRMRALAELRGLELGIRRSLGLVSD